MGLDISPDIPYGTSGVLVRSATGVPSISTTIPANSLNLSGTSNVSLTVTDDTNTNIPVINLNKPTGGGATNWKIENGVGGVDNGMLSFSSTSTANMLNLSVAGKVIVNDTSTSASKFGILAADNGTCAEMKINAAQASVTTADTFIDFRSTTGSEGTIQGTGVAGVLAYNTFTGSHWSQSDTITAGKTKPSKDELDQRPIYKDALEPGTVLVSTSEFCEWPGEVANHLPKCEVSSKAEDKAVYGVYGGHDREGDIMVLALGSGVVRVCDDGGPIEIGDFLCTSDKPGLAKRYDGNDMRVVLGKARQAFSKKTGTIACTYMAG